MRSSEFHEKLLPFNSRLYSLAYRMLHSREEAEDAVQEVYLKLWKMRDQLSEYKHVEGLAFRMTSNHCLDVLRRRSTGWEVMEKETYEASGRQTEDPEEALERKEQSDMLRKAIERLPTPCSCAPCAYD